MQASQFRAVPFNEHWINHDKIDIHAIYERPIIGEDGEQLVDEHGVPRWDLTGGLPVRRHHDWVRKGFRYVTLADAKSLFDKHVTAGLRAQGLNPADFIMIRNRTHGASPWNPQLYLRSQTQTKREQLDKIETLVQQLGSAAVLAVKQLDDPTFALPAYLRDVPAGGTVVRPRPSAVPAVATSVPTGPRVGPEVGDERVIDDEASASAAANMPSDETSSEPAPRSGDVVMGRAFSQRASGGATE